MGEYNSHQTKFIKLIDKWEGNDRAVIININHIVRITYKYIYLTKGRIRINKELYFQIRDLFFGKDGEK